MLTGWTLGSDRTFSMMNELTRRMSRLFEQTEVARWPALDRLAIGGWPPMELNDEGEHLAKSEALRSRQSPVQAG